MLLLLHIIVTYIKENIVTKLKKLYSPPRNPRVRSKSPVLFVKKPLCTGDFLPVHKIFIERPAFTTNTFFGEILPLMFFIFDTQEEHATFQLITLLNLMCI